MEGPPRHRLQLSRWRDQKAARIERLKTRLKLSKPAHASHPVWKNYKIYQDPRLAGIAICQLCFNSEINFENAEVKYTGGSPTNLMTHLNTLKPGHKAAYEEAKARKSAGTGRRLAVAAPPTAGMMTSFFAAEEATSWLDDLVRLIVNNYLSLSVRWCCDGFF